MRMEARFAREAQGAEVTAWNFDKTVNIPILLAVGTQLVFGVWWVSKLDNRVSIVETQLSANTVRIEASDKLAIDSGKSIARIEERQGAAIETSKRLEGKLDKLIDQLTVPVRR